jgi:hypothetical protein
MPISEAGAIGIVSMAARILPAVTIAHIAGPVALTGSLILGAASLLNCRAADPAPSIGRRNWRTARRTEIPRIHMRPGNRLCHRCGRFTSGGASRHRRHALFNRRLYGDGAREDVTMWRSEPCPSAANVDELAVPPPDRPS